MKAVFALCLAAASLAAQDTSSDTDSNPTRRITAGSQFFDHDFVNVFAFANGIWDSRVPVLTTNQSSFSSGFGWEAGGGVVLSHSFKNGGVTLNYRGSYRDTGSSFFGSGNQQSLAFGFSRRLNRRWTLTTDISGAILSNGANYFTGSSIGNSISPNPFSSESRFVDAGLKLTYIQSRRISYVFSGSLFLSSYNYTSAFSSRGVTGGVSMIYRTSFKTAVGASYSRTYYTYSQNAGSSDIDSLSLTLSHRFSHHWQLDLSGGVNRSHSKGIITTPVSFIFNGQNVSGYFVGPYDRTVYSPAYQGVLIHSFRHSSFALSGGQSIAAGNGTFLASRNQFANTTYSYSTRHSNLSFGGSYTRLSSVANTVFQVYSTESASFNYGLNLVRYVSANFRYDYLHYDGLFVYNGLNEQRVSLGLSLSSKSVPLTLF